MNKIIPVEVSARHCHLSKNDLEKIFGVGYELKKVKDLLQPSDFASETLNIKVGSKRFENVRIVGPTRNQTQVEISLINSSCQIIGRFEKFFAGNFRRAEG